MLHCKHCGDELRPLDAEHLRAFRTKRGLTLRQVADRAGSGLTAQALSKLERRQLRGSQLHTLEAVARGLGLVILVDRHGRTWFCEAKH